MIVADSEKDTRSTVMQIDTRGAGSLFVSNISEGYMVLATPFSATTQNAFDDSLSDEDLQELFEITTDDESTQHNLNGTDARLGKSSRRGWRKRFRRAVQSAVSAVVSVTQVHYWFFAH